MHYLNFACTWLCALCVFNIRVAYVTLYVGTLCSDALCILCLQIYADLMIIWIVSIRWTTLKLSLIKCPNRSCINLLIIENIRKYTSLRSITIFGQCIVVDNDWILTFWLMKHIKHLTSMWFSKRFACRHLEFYKVVWLKCGLLMCSDVLSAKGHCYKTVQQLF